MNSRVLLVFLSIVLVSGCERLSSTLGDVLETEALRSAVEYGILKSSPIISKCSPFKTKVAPTERSKKSALSML